MKIQEYKGYQLHVGEVKTQNKRQVQSVLIYRNGEPIGGTFADVELEDAIVKAQKKIDLFQDA